MRREVLRSKKGKGVVGLPRGLLGVVGLPLVGLRGVWRGLVGGGGVAEGRAEGTGGGGTGSAEAGGGGTPPDLGVHTAVLSRRGYGRMQVQTTLSATNLSGHLDERACQANAPVLQRAQRAQSRHRLPPCPYQRATAGSSVCVTPSCCGPHYLAKVYSRAIGPSTMCLSFSSH